MTCFKCKGKMVPGETTHVVDMGKCCVVIRRVPCLKCEQCGEVFYTGEVMATLDRLVQTMKDALTEIAVINYPDAVA